MPVTLRQIRDLPSHPDAVEFVEMVCGDLGTDEAAGLHRHCLVCDGCAKQLRALIGLRDLCGLTVPWAARDAIRDLGVSPRQH